MLSFTIHRRFVADKREQKLLVMLLGIAAALLGLALAWSFVLPQAPGRMADPAASLIPAWPLWAFVRLLALPIPRTGESIGLAVLVVSTARFALYGLAVFVCWNRRAGKLGRGLVIGFALLFFLTAACALPNIDRDIYNYMLSGRVGAVYGSNIYYVAPDRFPADPFYSYASQRYTHFAGDNKLPAWALLNMLLAWMGGNHVASSLLFYRFVFLFFNMANLGLVALIVRKLQPGLLLAALVLYGWNPIVITYGQSKADTLMVFFLLLAALALVYTRKKSAAVLLACSACVKLITLPLAGVYMLQQLRERRWRDLAAIALVFSTTVLLLYGPFWRGPRMLIAQLELVRNSSSAGRAGVGLLIQLGFALACLWVGYRRERGYLQMLRGWAWLMLLFAVFLTRLGFSWYLMTLVALAALAAEWRLALTTIAVSFVSFLMNAWDWASNDVVRLPNISALPRFLIYLIFIGAIGLALVAIELARRNRQQRGLQGDRHAGELSV